MDRGARRRLAGAHPVDRPQVARRGPAGPRHHPRPRLGRAGDRPARASRTRSSTSGSTRRSSTSAPPRSGPTPTPSDRDWRSWWYDADDVEYTQFMAKDNVPFHTVSFPVTLIGSREPWKRADQIKGFNWLTYYGGKFSTSQGRGVFMDEALDTLPGRLLALVPVRQRARVERRELHLGRLRRRGQQGPGRLLRQPREPLPHAVAPSTTGRSSRRAASPASARTQLAGRPREVVRAYTELHGRQGAAEVGQRAAPRLGRWPTPTGSRASRGRS